MISPGPAIASTLARQSKPQAAREARALLSLHHASGAELDTINKLVAESTRTWGLPERVRRLALPSLHYSAIDLEHMQAVLAEETDGCRGGVAVWEGAQGRVADSFDRALSLHGLYVLPARQHQGIGTALLEYVEDWAIGRGCDAIVLRAWRESEAFFRSRGFFPSDHASGAEQYPLRMCKGLA